MRVSSTIVVNDGRECAVGSRRHGRQQSAIESIIGPKYTMWSECFELCCLPLRIWGWFVGIPLDHGAIRSGVIVTGSRSKRNTSRNMRCCAGDGVIEVRTWSTYRGDCVFDFYISANQAARIDLSTSWHRK